MYRCHKGLSTLGLDCVNHSKGQIEGGGLFEDLKSGLWGELLHLLECIECSGMLWDALHTASPPGFLGMNLPSVPKEQPQHFHLTAHLLHPQENEAPLETED